MAEQDWDSSVQPSGEQMIEKRQTLSFLGRRSFVPRPLSEATEIFDTDNEDGTDDDSAPRSVGSVSQLTYLVYDGTALTLNTSLMMTAKPQCQLLKSARPTLLDWEASSFTSTISQ